MENEPQQDLKGGSRTCPSPEIHCDVPHSVFEITPTHPTEKCYTDLIKAQLAGKMAQNFVAIIVPVGFCLLHLFSALLS